MAVVGKKDASRFLGFKLCVWATSPRPLPEFVQTSPLERLAVETAPPVRSQREPMESKARICVGRRDSQAPRRPARVLRTMSAMDRGPRVRTNCPDMSNGVAAGWKTCAPLPLAWTGDPARSVVLAWSEGAMI